MSNIKNIFTQEFLNVVALGFLGFALSLELLIVVVLVFSFIPLPLNDFALQLFPLFQKGVLPEREMFFYRFFVFTNIFLQAGLVYFLRKRLHQSTLGQNIVPFLFVEVCWILLQLFAVFKIMLYGNPAWARHWFYAALGFSIVSKIFWPEIRQWLAWIREHYEEFVKMSSLRHVSTAAVCIFIIGVIYVGDVRHVLGLIMVWGNWEQFHVWRSQCILRSLDDVHFLRWMMAGAAVYFLLMFVCLRFWLNSFLLAAGAVCLGIKWQLFHLGVSPIVWQYPQKIDPSQMMDLALFGLLFFYVKFGKKIIFWMAVIGLFVEGGRHLWMALSAADSIPLYAPLMGRNFFAFAWQFFIPILYGFTFLIRALSKDRRREDVMVLAACLLGMAVFAVHIKDSTVTNYYTHSLPLVMVFAFWARKFCDCLTMGRAMTFKVAWVLVLLTSLITSNLFMIYPNIFNVSGIRWDQVKLNYQQRVGTAQP